MDMTDYINLKVKLEIENKSLHARVEELEGLIQNRDTNIDFLEMDRMQLKLDKDAIGGKEFNAGIYAAVKRLSLHSTPHVTIGAMVGLVEDLKRPVEKDDEVPGPSEPPRPERWTECG
ncbi:hypothetical protein LCGC14_1518600 [marine sediment metagenome]|uniref:Uncharacterized protein n=1 Tax=marine sediment metagenome TaxID=412755 RepID=A0A0F9IZA7_9ZZZZ